MHLPEKLPREAATNGKPRRDRRDFIPRPSLLLTGQQKPSSGCCVFLLEKPEAQHHSGSASPSRPVKETKIVARAITERVRGLFRPMVPKEHHGPQQLQGLQFRKCKKRPEEQGAEFLGGTAGLYSWSGQLVHQKDIWRLPGVATTCGVIPELLLELFP